MKLIIIILLIIFTAAGKILSEEEYFPETLLYKDTEMIFISKGDFWMGSTTKKGQLDEYPQHKVYLSDYYIDKYEVKNSDYCIFLNEKNTHRGSQGEWWIVIDDQNCLIELKEGLYKPKTGSDNYPVISVTWEGASAYATWMGKRLPTEAEWEKGAKGTRGNLYPWGMEWFADMCNNQSMNIPGLLSEMINFYQGRGILPCGSFPGGASDYGIMDMAGNVREWCYDWYNEDYYKSSPYKNPKGPKTGTYKTLRGGSWENYDPQDFRCADRFICDKDRAYAIGFRCVMDVNKK
jgi:formylglycine-generating enzyme required for sulfatase activity